MNRDVLANWPHWPWVLWGGYLTVLGALELRFGPQTQSLAYHQFADTRTFLGIPRFGDVASNAAILMGGLLGIAVLVGHADESAPIRAVQWIFFLGVVSTAVGSAYYHWEPGSVRLVWDRLPLGLVTACFPAFVLADRTRMSASSRWALWVWLAWGAASVLYWSFGDAHGMGDLRPYGLIKLYAIASCLALLAMFPRRHTLGWVYVIGIGLYVLAGVAEAMDVAVFSATGWISGHTCKHLLAGIAVIALAIMIQKREPLPG